MAPLGEGKDLRSKSPDLVNIGWRGSVTTMAGHGSRHHRRRSCILFVCHPARSDQAVCPHHASLQSLCFPNLTQGPESEVRRGYPCFRKYPECLQSSFGVFRIENKKISASLETHPLLTHSCSPLSGLSQGRLPECMSNGSTTPGDASRDQMSGPVRIADCYCNGSVSHKTRPDHCS